MVTLKKITYLFRGPNAFFRVDEKEGLGWGWLVGEGEEGEGWRGLGQLVVVSGRRFIIPLPYQDQAKFLSLLHKGKIYRFRV